MAASSRGQSRGDSRGFNQPGSRGVAVREQKFNSKYGNLQGPNEEDEDDDSDPEGEEGEGLEGEESQEEENSGSDDNF